jgi:ribulose kinase
MLLIWPVSCRQKREETKMNSTNVKAILLGVSLVVSVPLNAQDGRRPDEQQSRRYEDKAHHDSHEWNNNQDQEYRRYLNEHHRKYHDFDKASKREQNDFWTWVHSHSSNDRR